MQERHRAGKGILDRLAWWSNNLVARSRLWNTQTLVDMFCRHGYANPVDCEIEHLSFFFPVDGLLHHRLVVRILLLWTKSEIDRRNDQLIGQSVIQGESVGFNQVLASLHCRVLAAELSRCAFGATRMPKN